MLTLDDGGSGSVSLLIVVTVSCSLAKHCTVLSVLNNVAWMVFKAVRSAPISLWVLIILLLIRSVLAEILDVRSLTLTITTKRKQKNVTSVCHLLGRLTDHARSLSASCNLGNELHRDNDATRSFAVWVNEKGASQSRGICCSLNGK